MQCPSCLEQLDELSFSNSVSGLTKIWLNNKFSASFYVCTNRDCKNCGIVICIPWDMAEEE